MTLGSFLKSEWQQLKCPLLMFVCISWIWFHPVWKEPHFSLIFFFSTAAPSLSCLSVFFYLIKNRADWVGGCFVGNGSEEGSSIMLSVCERSHRILFCGWRWGEPLMWWLLRGLWFVWFELFSYWCTHIHTVIYIEVFGVWVLWMSRWFSRPGLSGWFDRPLCCFLVFIHLFLTSLIFFLSFLHLLRCQNSLRRLSLINHKRTHKHACT